MSANVVLESIEFNHDQADKRRSALNIRRNCRTAVRLPEWQRGLSSNPGDSPAAYSIASLGTQPITIRVTLGNSSAEEVSLELKADSGGILGPIAPVPVELPPGIVEKTISLHLTSANITEVGVHDVYWTWWMRPAGSSDSWQTLGRTGHRIYVLLDIPTAPWDSTFNNGSNPWTDLLDHSCAILAGTKRPGTAATIITKAINSEYRLKYNIENGTSAPYYEGFEFELGLWIDRVLNGKRTETQFRPDCPQQRYWRDWITGCDACARAVTLMATVVGARVECLDQQPFGFINVLKPIGRGPCNNPFYACGGNPVVPPGGEREPFDHHSFAGLDGYYYDACLRADLSIFERLGALLVVLLVLVVTLGRTHMGWLYDRAEGWLTDVGGPLYNSIVLSSAPDGSSQLPGPLVPEKVKFK